MQPAPDGALAFTNPSSEAGPTSPAAAPDPAVPLPRAKPKRPSGKR